MNELQIDIIKYGLHEAAQYWTKYLEEKRLGGKVPVLVEEFSVQLFFVECDDHGYPMRRYTDFITFLDNPFLMKAEATSPTETISHVYKKTLEIGHPILSTRFGDFMSQPYIFMWDGRMRDKAEIPLENLDVKKLLRLAQEAIQKREGLIVDEVLKNKLIK